MTLSESTIAVLLSIAKFRQLMGFAPAVADIRIDTEMPVGAIRKHISFLTVYQYIRHSPGKKDYSLTEGGVRYIKNLLEKERTHLYEEMLSN